MDFRPENLADVVPDPDLVIKMGPADLGVILLRLATTQTQNGTFYAPGIASGAGVHGFTSHHPNTKQYPRERHGGVETAISEALEWLKRELLILPAPGVQVHGGHMVFGRRVGEILQTKDLSTFRAASDFPKNLLHPKIADKVWLCLARNELEDAVFAAVKAVEIAVREASGLTADDIGVNLMRAAFNEDKGSLSDMDAGKGERLAMREFFSGTIGVFKNPSSHRDVPLALGEAREIAMTASLLLRIVDRAVARTTAKT